MNGCPVDCPWPGDVDIHVPWCREIEGHQCQGVPTHQHWPKKGMGGDPSMERSKIVAIICGSLHDLIDNGTSYKNDVITQLAFDGDDVHYYRIYDPGRDHTKEGWALLWKEIPPPSRPADLEAAATRVVTDPASLTPADDDLLLIKHFVTPKGLRHIPQELEIDTYLALGRALGSLRGSLQWAIGDFIIMGEARYGEMYTQALDLFDLKYDRLKNIVYVCNAFPTQESRRQDLPFSAYEELAAVANRDPKAADRYLTQIAEEGLNRDDIRALLEAKGEKPGRQPQLIECPECRYIGQRNDFTTVKPV